MSDEIVWIEWNEFLKFLQKNRHLLPMPVTLSNESLDGLLKIDAELTQLRAEVRTLRNAGVSLLDRAEAAEGALCRARMVIEKSLPNVVSGSWRGDWVVSAELMRELDRALSSRSPCPHEAALCRVREIISRHFTEVPAEVIAELSSTAPCPHEKRIEDVDGMERVLDEYRGARGADYRMSIAKVVEVISAWLKATP